MCCSKDQRRSRLKFYSKTRLTPTADITPAGDEIFLFYTKISLWEVISRNLHKFALFLELTNIPFFRYDPARLDLSDRERWGTADCWGEREKTLGRDESEASFLQTNNGTNPIGSRVFTIRLTLKFHIIDYQERFWIFDADFMWQKITMCCLSCAKV